MLEICLCIFLVALTILVGIVGYLAYCRAVKETRALRKVKAVERANAQIPPHFPFLRQDPDEADEDYYE